MTSEWMDKNVTEDIRRIHKWMLENRKYILVVAAWAVCFVLISHKILFERIGPPFYIGNLTSTDLALTLVLSIIAGTFLADVERVFFGYIGAVSLSIAILISIRTIRDFQIWGENYPDVWSWLLMRTFGLVFSQLFVAVLLSLFGVFIGGILGDYIIHKE